MNIPSTFKKASFLIETKEQVIAERDYMEQNWNNSMYQRMKDIAGMSVKKFGVTLSNLK